MDKPAVRGTTKGDEISRDIRPYLKLYFPLHVLDWRFEESGSGCYELTWLKVRERVDGGNSSNGEGWVYRLCCGAVECVVGAFDFEELVALVWAASDLRLLMMLIVRSSISRV